MPYDFRDPEYCPKSLTKYFYVLTTANKIAKICTYVAFSNNAFDRDQKMLLNLYRFKHNKENIGSHGFEDLFEIFKVILF